MYISLSNETERLCLDFSLLWARVPVEEVRDALAERSHGPHFVLGLSELHLRLSGWQLVSAVSSSLTLLGAAWGSGGQAILSLLLWGVCRGWSCAFSLLSLEIALVPPVFRERH